LFDILFFNNAEEYEHGCSFSSTGGDDHDRFSNVKASLFPKPNPKRRREKSVKV
jgi:hypothetical protein